MNKQTPIIWSGYGIMCIAALICLLVLLSANAGHAAPGYQPSARARISAS